MTWAIFKGAESIGSYESLKAAQRALDRPYVPGFLSAIDLERGDVWRRRFGRWSKVELEAESQDELAIRLRVGVHSRRVWELLAWCVVEYQSAVDGGWESLQQRKQGLLKEIEILEPELYDHLQRMGRDLAGAT